MTTAAQRPVTDHGEQRQATGVEPGRFFRRWVGWTTLGESVGFAVAATAGVVVATEKVPGVWAITLLLAGGAVEGALLGTGQVLALRTLRFPRSMRWRWPPLTSLAAVVAWSIGMLPSSLPELDWSSPMVWMMAGPLGLVLLASIPTAQLVVLRHAVRRSWRWLPANAAGWLLGIGWILAVSPLVNATTPMPELVAWYAAAGVLMALTVAVATGLCWVGWLRQGLLAVRPSALGGRRRTSS